MTLTAHALVAGAIASASPNPYIGVTLSAASHPFLDLIPHWDEGWGWRNKTKLRLFLEVGFDFLVGCILTYLLFIRNPFFATNLDIRYLAACVLASISWDLLEAPYLLLGWKVPPFTTVYKIQHHMQGKARLPWGIITQVATVALVIFVLQVLPLNF